MAQVGLLNFPQHLCQYWPMSTAEAPGPPRLQWRPKAGTGDGGAQTSRQTEKTKNKIIKCFFFLQCHLNSLHINRISIIYESCWRVQEGQASCSSIVQVLNRIIEGDKASRTHTNTHKHTYTHKTSYSTKTSSFLGLEIRSIAWLCEACRYCCCC